LERAVIYCRGEQSRSISAAVNRRRKGVRKEAKRKSACWGGRGGGIFGGWYEASHGNCSGGKCRTKPREKRYPGV